MRTLRTACRLAFKTTKTVVNALRTTTPASPLRSSAGKKARDLRLTQKEAERDPTGQPRRAATIIVPRMRPPFEEACEARGGSLANLSGSVSVRRRNRRTPPENALIVGICEKPERFIIRKSNRALSYVSKQEVTAT